MDLVNEQHIVLTEIGQYACQITGTFNRRPRGYPDINAHFIGNNMRHCGFSQTGRTVQKNMIQRFFSHLGGFNKDAQFLLGTFLADIFMHPARTQLVFMILIFLMIIGAYNAAVLLVQTFLLR